MTLNPTTADGAQPFILSQKVVLEKRTAEGILDLSDPQPPSRMERGQLTFDDVYVLYFRDNKEAQNCSWGALRAWLDSKSWVVRAKTW